MVHMTLGTLNLGNYHIIFLGVGDIGFSESTVVVHLSPSPMGCCYV